VKAASLAVSLARAEALLIAENGPSPLLEELSDEASARGMPSQQENAANFAQWVRARAARSGIEGLP